ncbi:MAG: amidohydrolase family protein [Cyclobacteriaceae bacterium]
MNHHKTFVLLIVLAVSSVSQSQNFALTNANILNVETGQIQTNSTILTANGKIVKINSASLAVPEGYEVINLEGRYVLPGLIDAHTHISSVDEATRAMQSGVTSARSASVPAYQDVVLREMVKKGQLAGPEILAAGVFVTPKLGETVLADERLGDLIDGVESEEALRKIVNINADRGVDVIKTRGTERAGLPDTDPRKQTYTEEQLTIIVDEAKKRGIPVMAHAHGDEGAYAAVKAGVISIEHGTYLSERTLQLMKESGTYLVPTYTTVVDLAEPGGDYDNPILTFRGKHMLPALQDAFKKAHKMGVKIATGADTHYSPTSITRISTEIENFTKLGMTPLEAIQAATTVAAELLGLIDRTGIVKEGYEADLIVLQNNPLENIVSIHDVLIVMSNGQMGLKRLPFKK